MLVAKETSHTLETLVQLGKSRRKPPLGTPCDVGRIGACQGCVKSMIDSVDLLVLIELKAESKEDPFSRNRARVIYSIVKIQFLSGGETNMRHEYCV